MKRERQFVILIKQMAWGTLRFWAEEKKEVFAFVLIFEDARDCIHISRYIRHAQWSSLIENLNFYMYEALYLLILTSSFPCPMSLSFIVQHATILLIVSPPYIRICRYS